MTQHIRSQNEMTNQMNLPGEDFHPNRSQIFGAKKVLSVDDVYGNRVFRGGALALTFQGAVQRAVQKSLTPAKTKKVDEPTASQQAGRGTKTTAQLRAEPASQIIQTTTGQPLPSQSTEAQMLSNMRRRRLGKLKRKELIRNSKRI
jgi:hypothetical protein